MATKNPTPQEQIKELDKQIAELNIKRDSIAKKINSYKTRKLDNAKAKKRLMAEAQKLVGMWVNDGIDSMYYHIKKVRNVWNEDVVTLSDREVTFIVESDEYIGTDKGMLAFKPGLKQEALYIRLLSPEYHHLTTEEVMKVVDNNVVSVIAEYSQACERHNRVIAEYSQVCERHNHKPIKVKVGKKA